MIGPCGGSTVGEPNASHLAAAQVNDSTVADAGSTWR